MRWFLIVAALNGSTFEPLQVWKIFDTPEACFGALEPFKRQPRFSCIPEWGFIYPVRLSFELFEHR